MKPCPAGETSNMDGVSLGHRSLLNSVYLILGVTGKGVCRARAAEKKYALALKKNILFS
jgi:hypothetical protein